MANGVDDATWTSHLHAHDYSRWFRDALKDEALAAEAKAIENTDGSARETRDRLFNAIQSRYSAPA